MNAYIVMFKSSKDHPQFTDDHVDALVASVETAGGSIKHRYASKNMRGFAGTFSEEFKAALEKEDAVKYIEPDGPVSIQA